MLGQLEQTSAQPENLNNAIKESKSGFALGMEQAELSYGEGVDRDAYDTIASGFVDYEDNKQYYDAWRDVSVDSGWNLLGNIDDVVYRRLVEEDAFKLDSNDNVVVGANGFQGAELFYDMDAVKGALLAYKHGFNETALKTAYAEITQKRAQEIEQQSQGTSVGGRIAGVIAGHVMQPQTLSEMAMSPGKIMSSTILRGMAKSAGIEALAVLPSEISREQRTKQHMEMAGLEYGLWDSVKNIMTNAGIAGFIRGVGSGVVDAKTKKEIVKRLDDPTDKEIVKRFFQRETYKLTNDTNKHIALTQKALRDMDSGRQVDVAKHTDVDINTKTDPNIEEISLDDELTKVDMENGYQDEVQGFENEWAKSEPIKEEDYIGDIKPDEDLDTYAGMATKEDGDDKIARMGELDPEIKAEMEAIQAELQGTKAMSFGGGDPLGGSLGGGFAGGTEGLYEDIVEGKDLTAEDYVTRILTGAAIGAGLGKKYGGKGGTKMFVGAKPYEADAFSNLYDKAVRRWIDDSPAEVKKTSGAGFLSQVLDHPELYDKYPDLKRIKVEFKDMEKGKLGSFKPESNKIVLNSDLSKDEIKSVLLHETQHGVQSIEKWAGGGSAKDFLDESGTLTKEGYASYRKLAGEQEARAVQAKLEHPELDPYEALKKIEGELPEPIVKMDESGVSEMVVSKKEFDSVNNITQRQFSTAKAHKDKSYHPLKRTIKVGDDGDKIVGVNKENPTILIGRDKNEEYFTIHKEDIKTKTEPKKSKFLERHRKKKADAEKKQDTKKTKEAVEAQDNVGQEKTLKQLEEENRLTAPKIPTEKIFNYKDGYYDVPRELRAKAEKVIDESPFEEINLGDIVPTQKNVTIKNLEKVQKLTVAPDEDISAIFHEGKFYLMDGHHRTAIEILDGQNTITARVYRAEDK